MKNMWLAMATVAAILIEGVAAQPSEIRMLVQEGHALYQAQKYTEAITKYDSALMLNPQDTRILHNKAESLAMVGKRDEALRIVKKLAEQSNAAAETYLLLGSLYDGSGKPLEAIQAYENGQRRNPKLLNLYYQQALTQAAALNDTSSAIETLGRGLLVDPSHLASYALLAQLEQSQNPAAAVLAHVTYLALAPEGADSGEALTMLKRQLLRETYTATNIPYFDGLQLARLQRLAQIKTTNPNARLEDKLVSTLETMIVHAARHQQNLPASRVEAQGMLPALQAVVQAKQTRALALRCLSSMTSPIIEKQVLASHAAVEAVGTVFRGALVTAGAGE